MADESQSIGVGRKPSAVVDAVLVDSNLDPISYLPRAGGNMADDAVLGVGTGAPASMLWETQDANANELLIDLPAGGAVDVPVIVIGQGVTGVDLALYNGVVDPRIAIFGIGAVTTAPIWEFRKARGTIAVPTIITTGDDLGTLNFYGYSGSTGYHLSAAIEVDSTGTIGPTGTVRVPSVMRFRTSTDAAPSVLTTALTIGADQGVTSAVNLTTPYVYTGYISFSVDTNAYVDARNVDSSFISWRGRDTGVGLVELAKFVGAADPYFQIGRDDTGVALNAVTDGLVLQMAGGTGNSAAGQGFGISVKIGNDASETEERGQIDLVLVTATNGAEDTRWDWYTQAAGAANLAMSLSATGVLSVDLGGSGSAAQVDLFDDYDDAAVLKQSIQQHNRQVLVDMGIAETRADGRGHTVKLQPMIKLLAGGIYQSRELINRLEDRIRVLEGVRA